MTDDMGAVPPPAVPPLPRSIWVVGLASLAGQLVPLGERGMRTDDAVWIGLSMVLSGLLVGYVSAGVVRARTVRLALAWVVLVLTTLFGLLALATVDDAGDTAGVLLSLVTSGVALAGLVSFCRSDWFRWQRTKPPAHAGPSIGQLVAIGVLVGVLGGLTAPVDGVEDLQLGAVAG